MLYDLAYQAGWHSRFNIDPLIGESNFKRLYREWVKKSVYSNDEYVVLTYRNMDMILGFVSLKMNADNCSIELLAVEEAQRHTGIGSKLIDACMVLTRLSGKEALYVSTQESNKVACSFYKSKGGTICYHFDIYHLWLNNKLYDTI